MKGLSLRQKKAHLIEIQVNGGNISDKVDWVRGLFEKDIAVNTVFTEAEMIDCIGKKIFKEKFNYLDEMVII